MSTPLLTEQPPWLPRHFAARLSRDLGLDLRALILPPVSFHPLDERPSQESVFFGSEAAREYTCLLQGDMDWFLTQAPVGYAQIGFWGHGVNSFAFYYARVDEWSRVFLRLPYGGVYMDNDEAARQIRRFVPAFFEFEQRIKPVTTSWLAIETVGAARYQRQSAERVFELRDSAAAQLDPLVCLEESLL